MTTPDTVVVQFIAPTGTVDTALDARTPAVQDLLTMLPMTLTFEDFAGRENIAYPPRAIRTAGSPTTNGATGEVTIYVPWGNLAFFYNGKDGALSSDLIHLGTFDATQAHILHSDTVIATHTT